jgi:hypothetical protein
MENTDNITWTVWGAGWCYSLLAPSDEDPVEVATDALESIFVEGTGEVGLGVLLRVTNARVRDTGDETMIPTSLALANAGLYAESSEIDKIWSKMTELEQLGHLVLVLGKNS